MESEFVKQLGPNLVSNLVFILAYLLALCCKNKKRSKSTTCCFEMKLEDILNNNAHSVEKESQN